MVETQNATVSVPSSSLGSRPVTGLEPSDDEGGLTVTFWVSTIHATLPAS